MATTTPDSHDRIPTMGPDPQTYDRYCFERTASGDGKIRNEDDRDRWIQSSWTVSLEAWK